MNFTGCLRPSLFQTAESADQIMVVVFVFDYSKQEKVHIKSWWLSLSFIISNTRKCRSNHGGCLCTSLFQTGESADQIMVDVFEGAGRTFLVAFVFHCLRHKKQQIRCSRLKDKMAQIKSCRLPLSLIVSDTSSCRSSCSGCLCLSLSPAQEGADLSLIHI